MRLVKFKNPALWSTLLLFSVLFVVFVLPAFPGEIQQRLFRIAYSVIYLTAILSLEKRSKQLLILLMSTVIIEWISGIKNFPILLTLAKFVNILFFFVIVALLIRQIATARKVSARIILDSVAGYLLLGLMFSIIVMFVFQHDPDSFAYNQNQPDPSGEYSDKSVPIYFSFVTLATLGYGDIVPIKPYTRSLSTLIAVSGQFYIAVIVALLVGKFSSQNIITDE